MGFSQSASEIQDKKASLPTSLPVSCPSLSCLGSQPFLMPFPSPLLPKARQRDLTRVEGKEGERKGS